MNALNKISTIKLFEKGDVITTTLNNSAVSEIIDLKTRANNGFFSLSYVYSDSHADARVDFTFELSPTGETGTWEAASAAIVADTHEASGNGSAGVATVTFSPTLSRYIKIIATETETQNAIFKAWLTIQ